MFKTRLLNLKNSSLKIFWRQNFSYWIISLKCVSQFNFFYNLYTHKRWTKKIYIYSYLYTFIFRRCIFLQNQCYKTESSRLDTNPFRYKSFLFKSKLIRYTCKVDLIQIHVTSSRFDTEYYTVYYFDSIAINIASSLLDSCSRWKRNR